MQWEFYGTVQRGQFTLSPEQLLIRQQALAGMKDGTQVFERIGSYSQPKTSAQLKAFWGLFIASVLSEFNDRGYDTSYLYRIEKPTGNQISGERLKDYMYEVCPVFNGDKRITISQMDVEQMCKFFDACRNWAASQWDIHVPEPDKNYKDKSISKLRESNNGTNF